MNEPRDLRFFACLAAQGSVMAACSWLARNGYPPSTVVLGIAVCFLPYAGVLAWTPSYDTRSLGRLATAASLIFGAAFVFAPPVMSDDLYRYLWEGRLWLEGFNPYRLAPDDPALRSLRNDLWLSINNESLVSIYPPLAQALFVLAAWLGGKVWTIKALALLVHAASAWTAQRIAGSPRVALSLALNPLLLSEAALNGHFDILTGVALMGAAWALARQDVVRAGAYACAAVGLKVVGVVVFPLFARWPRVLVASSLVSGLLLLPLAWWRSVADQASGPGQFAARWQGNESIFGLVDWLAHRWLEPPDAGLAARAFVVGALALLWVVLLRRRVPPVDASRAAIWAMLLLSPQVHPWYLAWLLPLEVAAKGRAALLWSAVVLGAYAPLDRWVREGQWMMPLWLQVLSYAVVILALAADPRRPRLQRVASQA